MTKVNNIKDVVDLSHQDYSLYRTEFYLNKLRNLLVCSIAIFARRIISEAKKNIITGLASSPRGVGQLLLDGCSAAGN